MREKFYGSVTGEILDLRRKVERRDRLVEIMRALMTGLSRYLGPTPLYMGQDTRNKIEQILEEIQRED